MGSGANQGNSGQAQILVFQGVLYVSNGDNDVFAMDVETGKTLWKYEQRAGTMSLVATGGGLVFGGDANGRFRAFDDRTGKVKLDYRPVHTYTLSNDISYIQPKARVY